MLPLAAQESNTEEKKKDESQSQETQLRQMEEIVVTAKAPAAQPISTVSQIPEIKIEKITQKISER